MNMSILNYFQQKKKVHNPHGPLSKTISPVTSESTNSEVHEVYASMASGCSVKSRKEKKPRVYSDMQRAEMGKLTCRVGPTEAAKQFTSKLGFTINESTMRS